MYLIAAFMMFCCVLTVMREKDWCAASFAHQMPLLMAVCGLQVRDVGMRLDVNDPPVVAELGRDGDRRGHDGRRVDGRGGWGGSGQADDGGYEPASDDGGK